MLTVYLLKMDTCANVINVFKTFNNTIHVLNTSSILKAPMEAYGGNKHK